jgi:hypothetical protein
MVRHEAYRKLLEARFSRSHHVFISRLIRACQRIPEWPERILTAK